MTVKICTWNINSVRLREATVLRLLREESPDVLCLQETKSPVEKLPLDAFRDLGYAHVVARGQKSYNGVMILSRLPIEDAGQRDFCTRGDARHVAARLPSGAILHNLYIPAGGDLPDRALNPKFAHKLDFLAELRGWFAEERPEGAILVGDLNIAPREDDVWSHKQLLRIVSHTPVEVEALAAVQGAGNWVDVTRAHLPQGRLYSWWSYRASDWQAADKGRRLDHIWATPDLAARSGGSHIARHVRGWTQPSDHVPVFAEFVGMTSEMPHDPRTLLRSLFDAAVAAALPEGRIRAYLPAPPAGRTVVIGAGKASAQLARAFEAAWDGPLTGVVVTRYGYAVPCERIEVVEAAHPEPDAAGIVAAQRLLSAVAGLGPDDLVVALISGGGSALLPAPPLGLTLQDEIALNRALLASGAPISDMNVLRKHVSRIKGGRLAAAAAPARVVSLIVSDIPGDIPALVASGPTVPDAGTAEMARAVVRAYDLDLPPAVRAHLDSPACAAPDPADPVFARNEVHIIASAAVSLEAAQAAAGAAGLAAVILSDAIQGEARDVGRVHAAVAREIAARNRPFRRPVILLSGGETTVTVRSHGKGGRNAEFLMGFGLAVDGIASITALAADTDGIDGTEDNAGGFADGGTAARIRRRGADPQQLLAGNDAWSALSLAGDLLVTGPTGTNVNDFRAILID